MDLKQAVGLCLGGAAIGFVVGSYVGLPRSGLIVGAAGGIVAACIRRLPRQSSTTDDDHFNRDPSVRRDE